ncbi:siderophore ferric iron reductase [Psychromonas sp. RZ22]|uniref:siderophore ferric iron reductase n=1 Tax=Psychromonas algarum TaxID=2555643 RepID=UPI0010676387|nr:siderophore ferric iron reductase [Psychromonas sp. RZ22]TEW54656.1 siderophore ferric iron reductase [Psychromonas sp. RZ22]
MQYISDNKQNLTPILDLCRHAIPYLDGKFESDEMTLINNTSDINELESSADWLIGNDRDRLTIQALRNDLEGEFPKAGHAYFIARSWQLLCWQPINIAFISIYGLKQLPDFSSFKQQRQHNSIFGFTFKSNAIATGEVEQLIPLASAQLQPLFEHYRVQLDSLWRCRPGYVQRFIVDWILSNLLKVRHLLPEFNDQNILDHARLWVKGMGLPEKHIKSSLVIKEQSPISHIRSSCCLAYKVNDRLCSNCPKLHK